MKKEEKEEKLKWGDVDDDEGDIDEPSGGSLSVFSTQPDENGIKLITTYRTNEKGQKNKINSKSKSDYQES